MFDHEKVLSFWYNELTSDKWWAKDDELDAEICHRFGHYLAAALQCQLFQWRDTPTGRLAEIIVLDQFSRNIFRGKPNSFSGDSLALALAQEAVRSNSHSKLTLEQKAFLYMPYMHSESLIIHDLSVKLHNEEGLEERLYWEHQHRNIIERFGRYPHRNAILGRTSTIEEVEFLNGPNSSF
jgi:uncharacterized protein (DUF924 family)